MEAGPIEASQPSRSDLVRPLTSRSPNFGKKCFSRRPLVPAAVVGSSQSAIASMFPPQHEPWEAGSTITYQLSLRIEYVKEPGLFVATSHTYLRGVQMEYLK
jgi:hypothetical protein